MSFSKKTREAVYSKYDGHCAYCGRAIDIKEKFLRNANMTVVEEKNNEKK